jgi:hypothetical protein
MPLVWGWKRSAWGDSGSPGGSRAIVTATCKDLQRLEDEARAARRGLWSISNAIPPWEFRRSRR